MRIQPWTGIHPGMIAHEHTLEPITLLDGTEVGLICTTPECNYATTQDPAYIHLDGKGGRWP